MLTGIAALSRYWPWAVGALAAIALGLIVWRIDEWRHGYLERDDAVNALRKAVTALEAEKVERTTTDAARLAAGLELERQLEAARANVRVIIKDRVKLIPIDRPCLTVAAGKALNELRR